MTLYQVLTLCGVGALTSAIAVAIIEGIKKWIERKREGSIEMRKKKEQQREEVIASISDKLDGVSKKIDERIDKLDTRIDELSNHMTKNTDKGLQALLRNKLYEIYDYWMPKSYAPTDVKENFQNLYNMYHQLGTNGVMDKKREAFLALPDVKARNKQTLHS